MTVGAYVITSIYIFAGNSCVLSVRVLFLSTAYAMKVTTDCYWLRIEDIYCRFTCLSYSAELLRCLFTCCGHHQL